MIEKRLEYFKKYFENKNLKWRVFYKSELPETLSPKMIYFIVTGDEIIKKQREIKFSIFYIVTREKDGALDFRKEVQNFIKDDLSYEFETPNFFCKSGYKISYSIDDERNTLRIAEIECIYDCTKEILDEEKFMNIEKLNSKCLLKE